MSQFLSIDVGSTYCKGALFSPRGGLLRLDSKVTVPTTPDYLPSGVCSLLEKLKLSSTSLKSIETVWSSSAKGGLRVVALGIVPELTSKMAREVACSAGAKIVADYNYKITVEDLECINKIAPDILLLTGGTDGGNEDILLHNAEVLKDLNCDIPVIYAGNRAVRSKIREMFFRHQLHITDNVLPDMEHPNPLPARNEIGKIFIEQIVKGKGLQEIIDMIGSNPLPTPYSLLEFIRKSNENDKVANFCVIDLGGATTDFYSCCKAMNNSGVILRGLREPDIKRTVEGDIGMRVSAKAASEVAHDYIVRQLEMLNRHYADFEQYVEKINLHPDALPETEQETEFDRILATSCVVIATERHAGRRRKVYTVNGQVEVQTGKDLSGIALIIGTGGYLSGQNADFMKQAIADVLPHERDESYLMPRNPEFRFDQSYLLPLLANASRLFPEAAVNTFNEMFLKET
ncbi:MAG: glutamate mutase L [Victivallaceae bacterium]|nr:glutamate mutase L [Victivallaceae bacterium]